MSTDRPAPGSVAWLAFSCSGLVLGGLLAFVLVGGRVPGLERYVDAPRFVRRCLVVHVNLMLGAWLGAFLAAMIQRLPGQRRGRAALLTAAAGLCLFVVGGMASSAEPVMSNYVPAIDGAPFLAGIGLFGGGLTWALLDWDRLGRRAARPAPVDVPDLALLRLAVLLYTLGFGVILYSAATTPRQGPALGYYEILFWGGGHLYQLGNVAGLFAAWLLLSAHLLGRPLLSRRLHALVVAALALPLAALPILMGEGTSGPVYYLGFETFMRWGTWPAPTLVLVLLA